MNYFKKLFVTILCTFSCYAIAASNSINIEYASPINGYLVQAVWRPDQEKSYNRHVVGPATITFHNVKTGAEFHLKTDDFGILKSKLPFKYSKDDALDLKVLDFNSYKHIVLDYQIDIPEKVDAFGDHGRLFAVNEPFFFEDIDFDGSKELLLSEFRQGQRFRTAFKAYKLDFDGSLLPEEVQITDREPFSSLDDGTFIDYTNKAIEIDNSNGSCNNSTYTYQLDKATNRYGLMGIGVLEDFDHDGYCYGYVYEIEVNKRLISKARWRYGLNSREDLKLKERIRERLGDYWFSFFQHRPKQYELKPVALPFYGEKEVTKKMTIDNSNGTCNNSTGTYQMDKATNQYNLRTISVLENYDNHCYKYVYEIEVKKRLISKTRSKDSVEELSLKEKTREMEGEHELVVLP